MRSIRNFSIIAHIDHGKSTLADRLLEQTGTVDRRDMIDQVLDTMDLEREKGITIKARAVRMHYTANDGETYELNLIDTPGHVDFSYEVSRSLAACEGALLVVDAAQGIEAQTMANVYLALEQDLAIVAVINKIDLPSADPEQGRARSRQVHRLARRRDRARLRQRPASASTRSSKRSCATCRRRPATASARTRALIFDSHYDAYKGVIAYVKIVDGSIKAGRSHSPDGDTATKPKPSSSASFRPRHARRHAALTTGEVGYVATGLKVVKDLAGRRHDHAGRQRPRRSRCPVTVPPSRWSSPDSIRSTARIIRCCATRSIDLQLNDASLTYEPESSLALGFGFRGGFLGLLHMEIVQERLEREYNLDLLATAPSVEYEVVMHDGRRDRDRQPGRTAVAGRDRRDPRSRGCTSRSSCRPATSAPSWNWSPADAACSTRWSISTKTGSS